MTGSGCQVHVMNADAAVGWARGSAITRVRKAHGYADVDSGLPFYAGALHPSRFSKRPPSSTTREARQRALAR
jgi:hypothetical protein